MLTLSSTGQGHGIINCTAYVGLQVEMTAHFSSLSYLEGRSFV